MLAKNRRENLLTHVKEARKIVEDAFDRALVGLGLPKDRDPLPAERLTNPDKQKIRKAVDEVIARDRVAGEMSYVDARRRYLEHCAFTLVNRVAALRAIEVRGFLPKSVIAQDAQYGGLSAWGRDMLEAGSVEILGASVPVRTADEARWQAIRAACVAASRDVAIVFDLQDEYSVLVPEPAAIKGLFVELTETVTTDDWAADDILGWVYQYYNVPANADYKERKKRRGYKMSADDMIVANQFYTPHWVVRVLVDNTLGRIWWESIPDLARKRLGEKESGTDFASKRIDFAKSAEKRVPISSPCRTSNDSAGGARRREATPRRGLSPKLENTSTQQRSSLRAARFQYRRVSPLGHGNRFVN
jgi:hypothetical protein